MKEFNLDEYTEGRPLCTRGGAPARIICTDLHNSKTPIAYAVVEDNGEEVVISCDKNGIFWPGASEPNKYNLMFETQQKGAWVNIYKDSHGGRYVGIMFTSREIAEKSAKSNEQYITTTEIRWEE